MPFGIDNRPGSECERRTKASGCQRMRRKRKGQTMHNGWHTKGAASARAPEMSLSLPLPEMDTSWGRLRGQLARLLRPRGFDREWEIECRPINSLKSRGLIVKDFTQLSLFASSHSPGLSFSPALSVSLCAVGLAHGRSILSTQDTSGLHSIVMWQQLRICFFRFSVTFSFRDCLLVF